MLAQQSPRWICRICLLARTRPQYRRLTQVTTQSPNPSEENTTPIPPNVNSNEPIRRVPLSELLARKKAEDNAPPDPLEQKQKGNGAADTEKEQHITPGPPPPQRTWKSRNEENSNKQIPRFKSSTSPAKTTVPQKKFSMKLHKNATEQVPKPGVDASASHIAATEGASTPDVAETGAKVPEAATTNEPTADTPSSPAPESIVSRRSKSVESPDTPLPSAPTTRLLHKSPSHRKPAKGKTAASRPRSYIVTQSLPDPQIHPADPMSQFPEFPGTAAREIVSEEINAHHISKKIWSESIEMTPIQPKEFRPVPTLEHGLDRVLFNPGVMYLRDPRSMVFNFDPYLEKIMPMEEFDYDALYEYITSSRDTTLVDMAKQHGASYVGSTSSMTTVLSHFHFLISAWRPVNIDMLSTVYANIGLRSFTAIARAPAGIFLRYKGDGVYAIDADKMYDTSDTVLSWLGRSMEKMLTLPPQQMEKFRKSTSHTLEDHERGQPEAYHYTKSGSMLMRSQLDCNDARLPGTGVFDLKTRACISVRMDVQKAAEGADYEIYHRTGVYNSFEREYYDMIRSAFLKYSLQVRIGKMDGIFVAYHNTKRIFGFQYISGDEMDVALHGGSETDIGRREFQFSVKMLNEALDRAVRRFPNQSLRLTFEARETKSPLMYIFAEPYDEDEIDAIQTGEYIQGLRLAEEQARREKEQKEAATASTSTPTESTTSTEPEVAAPVETKPESDVKEEDESLQNFEFGTPRDILPMVLRCRNYINGQQVGGSPNPSAEDKWELGYTFEVLSPERGLRLYQMCQDRRRKAFDEEFREQLLEESESAKKSKDWSEAFLMHLKELSTRGKKWREEFDQMFGSRDKVVWKEGVPPSKFIKPAWKASSEEDNSALDDKEA